MSIAQVAVKWTGAPGGDGFNIFYVRSSAPSPNPWVTFYAAIKSLFPSTITITVPNTGKIVDETNGKMTGIWSLGTATSTANTGTGAFSPQAGAQVKWATNDFVNGRRVWGRTFLVPVVSTTFTATGTLSSTAANLIAASGQTLINDLAQSLVVWARPTFVLGADGKPTDVIDRPGTTHQVTTATCPTKSATLNGRRDT